MDAQPVAREWSAGGPPRAFQNFVDLMHLFSEEIVGSRKHITTSTLELYEAIINLFVLNISFIF